MAAPRGLTYTAPTSSPLSGTVFTAPPGSKPTAAYNQYQQAHAKALGFQHYNEQRRFLKAPAIRNFLSSEKARPIFGPSGKLPPVERNKLLGVLRQFFNIKGNVVTAAFDHKDHTRGGAYDRFLIGLGRRVGNERWLPGETPR